MSNQVALIYTTIDSETAANEICEQLLKEKLIACANIFPLGTSVYLWEGKMERNEEHAVLLKTTADHVDTLMSRLESLHPYDCPCMLELTTESAHPAFADWVTESVE